VRAGTGDNVKMAFRFRAGCRALLSAALVSLAIARIAAAASPPGAIDRPTITNEGQKGGTAAQPGAPTAAGTVEGFRDTRFGMSEQQVRAAIRSDFPAVASSLTSTVNPSEKTTVLSLVVPDLLPHTGKAHISYIFGYRSKRLIQVNILWSSDRSAAGDEAIVGAANSLRDYFVSENFRPDSIVANRQLAPNTILVFRGSDDQKRTILLVLSGVAATARADDRKAPHPPLTLELSYIEDAAHPDVFKISKGQF
jgi:hypothetical protein